MRGRAMGGLNEWQIAPIDCQARETEVDPRREWKTKNAG